MKKVLSVLALIFALALVVTACDLTGGNTKKVTFDAQGGNAVATQTVAYGEKAVEPKNPVKKDYQFAGWSKDKDAFEEFDFSTAITEDTTLYAFWDEVSSVNTTKKVTFDTQGGSTVATQNVISGEKAIDPKDPVKQDYEFAGWSTDKDTFEEFDFSTAITEDTTLYAFWDEVSSVTTTKKVTFDAQGGSAVAAQIVVRGEKAVEPKDPVKQGYEFIGWSTNKDTYQKFAFSAAIMENTTLYAFWDEVSAEEAFNAAIENMKKQNYVNAEGYEESKLIGALVFEKNILKSIYTPDIDGDLTERWINSSGIFEKKQDGICYKENKNGLSGTVKFSINMLFDKLFLGGTTATYNYKDYGYGSTKETIIINVEVKISGLTLEATAEITLQDGLIKNITAEGDDVPSEISVSFTYTKNSKYYVPDDWKEIYKVYLITIDAMDQHWQAIYQGAQAAFEELYDGSGIEFEFKWVAPAVGKNPNQQNELIYDAVEKGADVIILAAEDAQLSYGAVTYAMDQGVEFIYVDSPSDAEGYVQFIRTNNYEAGIAAGEELLKQLAGKEITSGKIGIINHIDDVDAIKAREAGFRKVFEGKEEWEILDTLYCGGDYSATTSAANTLFANGCVAVFGTFEGATVGAGTAYAELADKTKKIACGFDFSSDVENLLRNDNLLFTVVQNPYGMGYKAMETAIQILKGNEITDEDIYVGVKVITAADLV